MARTEPVRYRARDQVMHLGEPYDGMVTRVHDRCMELLTVARQGNRHATVDAAERLIAQARALVKLLGMKNEGQK